MRRTGRRPGRGRRRGFRSLMARPGGLDSLARLLGARNLAYLSTIMPDGSPQLTPVWAGFGGGHVLVSTAEGRVKHSNVLRDPRVAVSVVSSEDPLDMASARGRVARIAPDYDYAYADELARRYMGRDRYPFRRPGERRTTLWILPASVHVMPALRPDDP